MSEQVRFTADESPVPSRVEQAEVRPRIHFSLERRPKSEVVRQADYVLRMARRVGLGGMLIVGTLIPGIAPWARGPFNISILLLALLALVGVQSAWNEWRRRRTERGLHRFADRSCRICVIGAPEEVLGHGSLDPVFFEPEVFRPVVRSPPTRRAHALGAAGMLTGTGAGLLLMRFSGSTPSLPSTFLMIWTGLLVGWLAADALWPTYFRVSPRRFECLQFTPLNSAKPRIDRFDLRAARILVDLRQWAVVIDDAGRTGEYSIRFVPGRRRLAYSLLLGAVAREQAPELPEDSLIG